MPDWLLILLVMVWVVLGINPAAEDYTWYQGLRRPAWAGYQVWIPLLWLALTIALYGSAVLAWGALRSWTVLALHGLVLLLIELYPWLMCRSRRLAVGVALCLLAWAVALGLALRLITADLRAALLLLPLLLWLPLQAALDGAMGRLNAPDRDRPRGRPSGH